jgi:hypothetical protein
VGGGGVGVVVILGALDATLVAATKASVTAPTDVAFLSLMGVSSS